jgi:DNA repair exonuclease SbcCD ATPase subunit
MSSHSNEKVKDRLSKKKFDQKLNEEIISEQKELISQQKNHITKLTDGINKQKALIALMNTKIDTLLERKIQADELISLYEQKIQMLEAERSLPENFVRSTEPIITNDQTCAICLEEVLPMSRDMIILNCSHRFHFSCLRQCIRKLCPICRIAF